MANLKLHVKKNDTVVVVSGKDAGKTGEVLKVYPKTGRVLVQGVNIVKKHQKPSRANAQGGIIEKEGAILCFGACVCHRQPCVWTCS